MDNLPAVAGGRVQLPKGNIPLRRRAGFLLQFPFSRLQRILAPFELAGGQLLQHLAVGIAELPHKKQLVRIRQRGDAYAAGMLHYLPLGGPPIREFCFVHPQVNNPALKADVSGQGFFE